MSNLVDQSQRPLAVTVEGPTSEGVSRVLVRTNLLTLAVLGVVLALVSWSTIARYNSGDHRNLALFVAANIGLLLVFLSKAVNRTSVTIDRESLRRVHGPISLFSRETIIPTGDVRGLSVAKSRVSSGDSQGSIEWWYQLEVTTATGQSHVFLSGQTEGVTRYVERTLRGLLTRPNGSSITW